MRRTSPVKVFVAVMLLFWVAAEQAMAQERMSVRTDTANIRSGPSLKEQTLWQVEKFYPLVVVEKKGEWRRVKDFEGDQGWIHSSMLDTSATVIVKSDQCNLRSGPGKQYDIAFTVEKGIPFKVVQTKGDWLEVQHADGDRGWLFKSLVW